MQNQLCPLRFGLFSGRIPRRILFGVLLGRPLLATIINAVIISVYEIVVGFLGSFRRRLGIFTGPRLVLIVFLNLHILCIFLFVALFGLFNRARRPAPCEHQAYNDEYVYQEFHRFLFNILHSFRFATRKSRCYRLDLPPPDDDRPEDDRPPDDLEGLDRPAEDRPIEGELLLPVDRE